MVIRSSKGPSIKLNDCYLAHRPGTCRRACSPVPEVGADWHCRGRKGREYAERPHGGNPAKGGRNGPGHEERRALTRVGGRTPPEEEHGRSKGGKGNEHGVSFESLWEHEEEEKQETFQHVCFLVTKKSEMGFRDSHSLQN